MVDLSSSVPAPGPSSDLNKGLARAGVERLGRFRSAIPLPGSQPWSGRCEAGNGLGMDTVDTRARILKALGDPTRLRIFEFLCTCAGTMAVGEAGEVRQVTGACVGEVCCSATDICSSSTVSHHLKELRNAGLISMSRQGKNTVCAVVPEAVTLLASYFGKIGVASERSSEGLAECR
jgi:ArsR family transcriptional regulator, arsenate/arsenite/antimonite-responsive transcriptional repressor